MPPTFRFAQFVIDSIWAWIPRTTPSKDALASCKIVAHRGWHNNIDLLENTIASFQKCVDAGVHGIEFDIRWTKDLVPVVHHDPDLKRLFKDHSLLCDLSFFELRERYPLIPSLAEVVKEFGEKIHFFVELKIEDFSAPQKQKETLKQILSPLQEVKHYHLFSLFYSNFQIFDNFKKETYILVSTNNPKEISEIVEKERYGGITGHYLLLKRYFLNIHLSKRIVGTGFPRSKNVLWRELGRGVEYIFTNHPGRLLKYIQDV